MPIKLIVNGAYGKMGALASQTLSQHSDFDLVATLGRQDNLTQVIQETQPDIVVDLTNAHSVLQNSQTIIAQGVRPVIGTTGLTQDQISQLQQQCLERHLGGFIIPNFSIAVVLMMHLSTIVAKYFPNVEIIESHHAQKLDAPSGTALKTAAMIQAVQQDRKDNIPIHSVRLPGILAQQQVIFGNQGETLEIRHNSIDRACFMPGLILACQEVMKIDKLVYGLECILK